MGGETKKFLMQNKIGCFHQLVCAGSVSVVLFVAALFSQFPPESSRHGPKIKSELCGPGSTPNWFAGRSDARTLAMCRSAEAAQICSHQALAPDMTEKEGSAAAVRSYWRQRGGITCFDLDLVLLAEGQVMVSHPKRLREALSLSTDSDLRKVSVWGARGAGLDIQTFPLLSEMLPVFAELKSESADDKELLLLLDLKEQALSPSVLEHVLEVVKLNRLQDNVVVWFLDRRHDLADVIEHFPTVRMIRGFRDNIDGENVTKLSPDAMDGFHFAGPSVKLPKLLLHKLVTFGIDMISWIVDDEGALTRALEMGSSGVISNRPRQIKEILEYWLCVCKSV